MSCEAQERQGTKQECTVCGTTADLMAVWKGEIFCFHCLSKRYPFLVDIVVSYLPYFLGV